MSDYNKLSFFSAPALITFVHIHNMYVTKHCLKLSYGKLITYVYIIQYITRLNIV